MYMHNTTVLYRHELYTSQLGFRNSCLKRFGKNIKLNFLMRTLNFLRRSYARKRINRPGFQSLVWLSREKVMSARRNILLSADHPVILQSISALASSTGSTDFASEQLAAQPFLLGSRIPQVVWIAAYSSATIIKHI